MFAEFQGNPVALLGFKKELQPLAYLLNQSTTYLVQSVRFIAPGAAVRFVQVKENNTYM